MKPINKTIIVTSAAYLDPQLEAEFGRIPPAFLPLAGQRLYRHQFNSLSNVKARLILSIPEDFFLSNEDTDALYSIGVELIRVPLGLTLGQSIVHVINMGACAGGAISILHGDTLLTGVDFSLNDYVAIGKPVDGYQWGQVIEDSGTIAKPIQEKDNYVDLDSIYSLTGWFSFASGFALVQAITRSAGNFFDSLFSYSNEHKLTPFVAEDWFDFGHADTYYQSRRRLTTQRAFNELQISKRIVTKSSQNFKKIEAEADWFRHIPSKLRLHTPAFLDQQINDGKTNYSLEYLYLPTLSDLLVFGRLSLGAWEQIFAAVDEVLLILRSIEAPPDALERVGGLYTEKTLERLREYEKVTGVDLSAPCRFNGSWLPSITDIVLIAAKAIPTAPREMLSLVHGDLCFSNLLYDHRADLIRVIDPRGLDAHGHSFQYGDIRYDVAKLYHSIVGRYDHILAGHYSISQNGALDFSLNLPVDDAVTTIERRFLNRGFAGLCADDAKSLPICILLFLSMLPLHEDRPDRQSAFLANALRLFKRLEHNES
jgi:hypothetical protein